MQSKNSMTVYLSVPAAKAVYKVEVLEHEIKDKRYLIKVHGKKAWRTKLHETTDAVIHTVCNA